MRLRPITRKSAEAEAADALRDHVVGGGVRPGARLTEERLSGALGLSRTTIRTALHQLANERLVVQVPYPNGPGNLPDLAPGEAPVQPPESFDAK